MFVLFGYNEITKFQEIICIVFDSVIILFYSLIGITDTIYSVVCCG